MKFRYEVPGTRVSSQIIENMTEFDSFYVEGKCAVIMHKNWF